MRATYLILLETMEAPCARLYCYHFVTAMIVVEGIREVWNHGKYPYICSSNQRDEERVISHIALLLFALFGACLGTD